LTNEEFLRRFPQHVLPRGFPRIRYFGWLSNRKRSSSLPVCRDLLNSQSLLQSETGQGEETVWQCPCCRGQMQIIERLSQAQIWREEIRQACVVDSS
jgi:hypothetical protein